MKYGRVTYMLFFSWKMLTNFRNNFFNGIWSCDLHIILLDYSILYLNLLSLTQFKNISLFFYKTFNFFLLLIFLFVFRNFKKFIITFKYF